MFSKYFNDAKDKHKFGGDYSVEPPKRVKAKRERLNKEAKSNRKLTKLRWDKYEEKP
jgi:hypothetical protein